MGFSMRIKKTEIPIYRIPLTLIESSDIDKIKRYFKRIKFDFEDSTVYAHVICHYRIVNDKEYHCIYMIFNRNNSHRKLKYSVIAHECKHAADYVFDYVSAENTKDEPYAYLLEYIFIKVCKFLNVKEEI